MPPTGLPAEKPAWYSQPCLLGVDEAGRGPVLGPMVYGAAFCALSNAPALAKAAYADSKTLTEEKREALFEQLQRDPQMGWMTDTISAAELSAKMLRREKYSLNAVSFDSAFGLIQARRPQLRSRCPLRFPLTDLQAAMDAGVNVAEVYVDTVGDAELYTRRLSERFAGVRCVAKAKADSLYPCVSAASICAKVTRDRQLRDFSFEPGLAGSSRAFGCGYPGGAAAAPRRSS